MITKREITRRIRFKTNDPTCFPENSKETEEPTQQNAVSRAAISPIYNSLHRLSLLFNIFLSYHSQALIHRKLRGWFKNHGLKIF